MSDPGCVSADTEYLTPTGWKRIDQYTVGDLVAQVYPTEREIEFVAPTQYIKLPCTQMVAIAPARGMSQRLSPEHRVLHYGEDGNWEVCSALAFMHGLKVAGANHFKRKFLTTFSVRNTTQLDLTDAQLRLMVAVIADGHFNRPSARVTVRLKKLRKIERMRVLLRHACIEYAERTCGGQPDFQVFRFDTPRREKEFTAWWWNASQAQLELIADELQYWDSSVDIRPSKGIRFSTMINASADFAQYALAAAKHPAVKGVSNRGLKGIEFYVHAREHDTLVGPGRASSVNIVENPEGFKYCFEVPTSFLLLRHNGRIFATGNTGKTLAHLLILNDDYNTGSDGRTLVVCPKTLMRSAWGHELDDYFPWLSYSVADAASREEAFKIDTQVVITNTDAAVTLAKNPKWLRGFDKLIIDESTSFKHASSQRSKAAYQLSKLFRRKHLLTGTPNPNSVTELWHQMLILDGGKRLGPSFFRFRGSVQEAEQVGPQANMLKWHDKPGATDAVFSLIADVTIRHSFESVMTHVPPNHVSRYEFDLNKKTQKIYEEFATHMVATINEERVNAVHASSLRQKLLQIASGAVYDGGDDRSYALVDTQRYELAAELIEQYQHSVVFFNWFHQREQMCALLERRGISFAMIDGTVKDSDRERIVREFQAGRYQTVLLHPRTGAHGLTLTRGEACIMLSPFYEADLLKQAIHRIYRGTQDKATNTILIQARNTVEALVYGRLDEKTTNMNDFLGLVVASQRRRE